MYRHRFVVLSVDLSTGDVSRQETIVDEEAARKDLGGRGLATRHVLRHWDPRLDPLSPEAEILFVPGVLTGTIVPSSGRTSVLYKSPATGRFFKTNVGGHFGAQLKYAGYDLLSIRGRAERPVYLHIHNERVELRPAAHLWGKDVRECNRLVREELDEPEMQLACIGPAGENGVMYASIQVSIYNAAGRGGGGALMGSKNLKAVAVRGTAPIRVAEPQRFMEVVGRLRGKMQRASGVKALSDFGTSVGVESTNAIGAFPVNNFQESSIEDVRYLTGQHLTEGGFLKRKIACFSCPVACHRFVTVDAGPYRGTYTGGPEYETLSALGGGCGVTDTAGVIKANELCNLLGLDTISTGGCIQWLIECRQRGILSAEQIGDLDLRWGNPETVIRLVRLIADREGIGDLLARGLKAAAEEMGRDSYRWALQANGLEQSRVETRSTFSYALAFTVNSRGPDHLNTECLAEFGGSPEARALIARITGSECYAHPFTLDKRAEIVRWHEDIYAASDSLGICAFPTTAQHWMDEQDLADLYGAATGVPMDARELMEAGRRVITMERLYNAALGYTREQDVLPYRLMNEMQKSARHGNAIDSAEQLDSMKDEYYRLHEWDRATGLPTAEVLKKLGLDEFAGLLPTAGRERRGAE